VCNHIAVHPNLESRVTELPSTSESPAARALLDLVGELDRCIGELTQARARADDLLRDHRSGLPWLAIVTAENRPLVVERISTVLAGLATAGHAWRREQALALQAEQVSINRIAALFGVTRQRISALLRERDPDLGDRGDDGRRAAPSL
jgi:hypothetical protein